MNQRRSKVCLETEDLHRLDNAPLLGDSQGAEQLEDQQLKRLQVHYNQNLQLQKKDKLNEDQLIGMTHQWRVKGRLGAGGLGDVYKVVMEKRGKVQRVAENQNSPVLGGEYAMKTEFPAEDRILERLKFEVVAYDDIQLASAEKRKHFCEVFDKGQLDNGTKFLVMTLTGPSLEELRRNVLRVVNFNQSTTMQIAFQTLNAIRTLHDIGYLHRDIKPRNFSCGLNEKQSTIYMLDFGTSRFMYMSGTRELRPLRKRVAFMGTLRYASRAGLSYREQGRNDDLEMWLYMTIYFLDSENGLPWRNCNDMTDVLRQKKNFFKHKYPNCYALVPLQFKAIVDYLDSLEVTDQPDYSLIERTLKDVVKKYNISLTEPLQWIKNDSKRSENQSMRGHSLKREAGPVPKSMNSKRNVGIVKDGEEDEEEEQRMT